MRNVLHKALVLQMEAQTVKVKVCLHSFLFYKNVVFPAQAEYYYFSARDFGLKTFLYFSYIIAYDISVLEFQPRYSYKIYYKKECMCQAAHQVSTGKNNLTKKKNNLPSSRGLFTMSDYKALDINIEARVKPPEVI